MKGIILAGGSGTRLHPLTKVTSKQLLPIYDKPMIYYPLSVLMLADIQDILIISTPMDLPNFERLLGDGSQFGLRLSYCVQETPNGIASAFTLGENFIGKDNVCLILGDNIFYGNNFKLILRDAVSQVENRQRPIIFGKYVTDPHRFGVAELDGNSRVLSLEEKPTQPKSNYAVAGLYFYDNRVIQYAKRLKPSARGEYEITDLNKIYLQQGELNMQLFGRGFAWIDAGTVDSLEKASEFVKNLEDIQGIKISVPEEIAFYNGWIDERKLLQIAKEYGESPYGEYLYKILTGGFQPALR